MDLMSLGIAGAYLVRPTPASDDRGSFSRLYCAREFDGTGISRIWVQANASRSFQSGTLRGIHFQIHEGAEAKLVSCSSGRVWDVVVDLRPNSKTFMQWRSVVLEASSQNAVFVPEGCGHGFITLEPNCEVRYLVSNYYSTAHERSIRFDDPDLNISWPLEIRSISDKDRQGLFLRDLDHKELTFSTKKQATH